MIVDLFAGPGGWDLGLQSISDKFCVGVELDAGACATRAAAGLPTIRADVSQLQLRLSEPLEGLIASPPCQTFSNAGRRSGINQIDLVVEALQTRKPVSFADPRTSLILQPLQWIERHDPTWIALEQVTTVSPIWEAYAEVLTKKGYSVWCGKLNAADYGVPQTRRRAVLTAHKKRSLSCPPPTHSKNVDSSNLTLLGGPSDLLPWVTMADALGWDGRVGFPRKDDLGTSADGYRERDWRSTDRPAQTVTEKARSWQRQPGLVGASVKAAVADWKPWAYERPATTVAGRPLVADPGTNANRRNGSTKSRNDGIKISAEDALVLQSFPRDYPIQGARTKQFEQIGNAVPPMLAAAVLRTLL